MRGKMGLFDSLFKPKQQNYISSNYFTLLDGYVPRFTSFGGMLYENELVRSAIDARSRHISKLSIDFYGSAKKKTQTRLKKQPNEYQSWSQFLYRLNTILDMQNTAFIVPTYDEFYENVIGVTTCLAKSYELVEYKKEAYIKFCFKGGETATLPLNEIGIMSKFQYENDLFGSKNTALNKTMDLIAIQNQGIEEAIKNGASFRFSAETSNFSRPEDLAKERDKFSKLNLRESGGGLLLFPNTYKNIKQLNNQPYSVNKDQMELIQDNVFRYFGVNDDVMRNSAKGDELDAFFNGAIEPFAIQLSDTLTRMLFTLGEQANGCRVVVSANRLQYMTTSEKVSMAQQLGDRGAITINEVRALFNYPPLEEGGDKATIRGEYYFVNDNKEGDEDDASEE